MRSPTLSRGGLGVVLIWAVLSGCGASPPRLTDRASSPAAVAAELVVLSRGASAEMRAALGPLLADNLAKDVYSCLPSARWVFARPQAAAPTRLIEGRMPHYNWFLGPMVYRVSSSGGPSGRRWLVQLNIAFIPSRLDGSMQLPDCSLRSQFAGESRCEGVPFPEAPGLEACPESSHFEAPASRHNLQRLLAQWSVQAEQLYNRDAAYFDLPVRYDFNFTLVDDSSTVVQPVDLRLPLWLSCGRTPYFIAFRTGWSIPVVAHEVGHYLGLIDEYETFSGISSWYPKTPFKGSELSRMGVSMKTYTRLWPLHHYLILRRYHCSAPSPHDSFSHVLSSQVLSTPR